MRNTISIVLICLLLAACGKDKFKTEPQIKFKSVKPDAVESSITRGDPNIPVLTVSVTDGNGDLGYKEGEDTSYIYVKNLTTAKIDSFILPDLSRTAGKNFEADIEVALFNVLGGNPSIPRPKIDTLFFEVYVTDFAKNKSNVIVTDKPVYFISR